MSYKKNPYIPFTLVLPNLTKCYTIEKDRLVVKEFGTISDEIALPPASVKKASGILQSILHCIFDRGDVIITDSGGEKHFYSRIQGVAFFRKALYGEYSDIEKEKMTDFGPYSIEKITPVGDSFEVKTPRGIFINNCNGTVMHKESGLVFISAPWGTRYENGNFIGEPSKLVWWDAVTRFGRGANVGLATGCILGDDLKRCAEKNEYKKGKVRIMFNGQSDWRLATADELDLLGMCVRRGEEDQEGWSYSNSEASVAARKSMFPYFSNRFPHIWSANADGALAWVLDKNWSNGDYKVHTMAEVLFVRNSR